VQFIVEGYPAYAYTGGRAFDPKLPAVLMVHGAAFDHSVWQWQSRYLANIGDAKSLVIHPATTTHFRMDDAALAAAGITPGTVRLSIGLEHPDDLLEDLARALRAARK